MNARTSEASLADAAARGIRIPPQPQVLLDLAQLMATDDYDARRVAAVIGRDPGLAAMIFKVVHSPALRGTRPPASLEQAIMRIGVGQTLNIARAVALSTSVGDANRRAYELFWRRSRELAELAALVADERVSVCNIFADQAYMAGMFLECGVPVLMQRFPDYCETLLLDERLDFPSLREEDQRFDVDHCSIGYLVARHWHLPEFVAQAILHHDVVPRDELGAVRSLVAILHLANHARLRAQRIHDYNWDRVGLEVLSELGLHPDDLNDYLADLQERGIGSPV
ncbi:HDOD domain-containing protein [Thauera sp. CAU 1555]|uniref:HDOD domain-containing protein n=1 Tax=Thauera sedimentorum TaxID=2767595 RepID=A0ABR9BFL3_9RHOO|nr:HDOD domain-containing protein [Thauera sedimentorum]MBC9073869.1 HDOD domain-containing protein [Thauera sedimentorum]MBD8504788.1 HDOD domain-containing protein [Thauera sedimentorum]